MIDTSSLRLADEFVLRESQDFYFGRISDVAVDAAGRFYVADGEFNHIKVFSPEGDHLYNIGREGQGPGEFQRLRQVVVGRGDSLFVYDGRQRRISVFAPGEHREPAYSVSLAEIESGYPISIRVPSQGGFLVQVGAMFSIDEEASPFNTYRRASHDGAVHDTILAVSRGESIVNKSSDMIMVASMPFGRSALVAIGPDDVLYSGWTDSLSISAYNLQGERTGGFSASLPVVPVTDAEVDSLIAGYENEQFRNMVAGADLPDTRPAFERLLVDEQGRVWVDVIFSDKERSSWWVFDETGARIAAIPLPDEVRVQVIRDGYAYGSSRTDEGLPIVVRYEIVSSG